MKRNPKELEDWVVAQIARYPGITAKGVAALYKVGADKVLGPYIHIARVVARLRQTGVLEDVAYRCAHCGNALTRGQRNVPLKLTAAGQRVADALLKEEEAA